MEHDAVCCKCHIRLTGKENIYLYDAGAWFCFGVLWENLELLYENDEIAHEACIDKKGTAQ